MTADIVVRDYSSLCLNWKKFLFPKTRTSKSCVVQTTENCALIHILMLPILFSNAGVPLIVRRRHLLKQSSNSNGELLLNIVNIFYPKSMFWQSHEALYHMAYPENVTKNIDFSILNSWLRQFVTDIVYNSCFQIWLQTSCNKSDNNNKIALFRSHKPRKRPRYNTQALKNESVKVEFCDNLKSKLMFLNLKSNQIM